MRQRRRVWPDAADRMEPDGRERDRASPRIKLPKTLDSLVYMKEEVVIDPLIAARARGAGRPDGAPQDRAALAGCFGGGKEGARR
jgi:hypothetical protein